MCSLFTSHSFALLWLSSAPMLVITISSSTSTQVFYMCGKLSWPVGWILLVEKATKALEVLGDGDHPAVHGMDELFSFPVDIEISNPTPPVIVARSNLSGMSWLHLFCLVPWFPLLLAALPRLPWFHLCIMAPIVCLVGAKEIKRGPAPFSHLSQFLSLSLSLSKGGVSLGLQGGGWWGFKIYGT